MLGIVDRYLLQLGFICAGCMPTGAIFGSTNRYESSEGDPITRQAPRFDQDSAKSPQGDFGAVLLDSMDAALIAGPRGLDEVARDGPAVGDALGAGYGQRGRGFSDHVGAYAHAASGPRGTHQAPETSVLDGVLRGTRWDDPRAGGQDQAYGSSGARGYDGPVFPDPDALTDQARGLPDFSGLGVRPTRYGPPPAQEMTRMSGFNPGPTQLYPPPPPPFKPSVSKSFGDEMLMDAWGADERREMPATWNMGPRTHSGNHERPPENRPKKAPEILLEG